MIKSQQSKEMKIVAFPIGNEPLIFFEFSNRILVEYYGQTNYKLPSLEFLLLGFIFGFLIIYYSLKLE